MSIVDVLTLLSGFFGLIGSGLMAKPFYVQEPTAINHDALKKADIADPAFKEQLGALADDLNRIMIKERPAHYRTFQWGCGLLGMAFFLLLLGTGLKMAGIE